jgi:protease-4
MPDVNASPRSPLRRLAGGISTVFAVLYRVFFILSLLIGFGIAWLIWSGGPAVRVGDNVALVVAPAGALVDQVDVDPSQRLMEQLTGEGPSQTSITEIREAFIRGAKDPRINFAVLKLDGLGRTGFAQMEEVIEAISIFRESGKPVEVWANGLDQAQYLLASHADSISLDPYGAVWVEGLSYYGNYFAEALDKVGAEVTVFRVGEFKSAVEPFIRRDMSPEARLANEEWLGDLWRGYLKRVAEGRAAADAEITDLEAYIRNLPDRIEAFGGDFAALQLNDGLIDRLEPLEAFRARMGERVGIDEDGHGSFNQIHHRDYLRATRRESPERPGDRQRVAQITIQGPIVDGYGDVGTAGGDQIAELLHEARRDDTVKAVLLRIDSPGGSVTASERIRRAVLALREAGKPVVASMSSQAASGGYWVAMDSDEIWAYESTITGSIGVFGLWLSFEEGLRKLGIRTDGVGTTPLAGGLRIDRALAPEVGRVFQASVNHIYNQFLDGVAAARDIDRQTVDTLAEGRVWSGSKALSLDLVDRIGGLHEAADRAAELAGLAADQYYLDRRSAAPPRPFPMLGRFFGMLEGHVDGAVARWLSQRLGLSLSASEPISWWLNDRSGRYALCACDVRIGGESMQGGR